VKEQENVHVHVHHPSLEDSSAVVMPNRLESAKRQNVLVSVGQFQSEKKETHTLI
jgi:hypothetical protein